MLTSLKVDLVKFPVVGSTLGGGRIPALMCKGLSKCTQAGREDHTTVRRGTEPTTSVCRQTQSTHQIIAADIRAIHNSLAQNMSIPWTRRNRTSTPPVLCVTLDCGCQC